MDWPFVYLCSLLLFWLSLAILLLKWPRVNTMSISRHAAKAKDRYLFFTFVQITVGLVTFLFLHNWFIPHFSLNSLFTVVASVTILLQLIAAILPDTQRGLVSTLHLHIANAMALGIFATTLLLTLSSSVPIVPTLIFGLAAIYMSISVALIVQKKGKPELLSNYLIIQVLYIVFFQIAILLASYIN